MYKRYVKRPLDITLAVAVIVLTLPLALFTALLIKVSSKGPVLFRQERTGIGGANFKIYKFRTMTHNNDVRDITKGNQLTTVGKYVRALSVDEIPQLINIVKGEMSFIGPRPWIPEYYEFMTKEQRHRVDVLPGMTGLAQVHGRNSLTIYEKIDYDLGYVNRISPREDAKIVFLTFKAIVAKGSREIEKHGIHTELSLLKDQRG